MEISIYILTFLLLFGLASFTLYKNPKNRVNTSFAAFTYAASLWIVTLFLYYNLDDYSLVQWMGKLNYVVSTALAYYIYRFAHFFPIETVKERKWLHYVIVFVTLVIVVLTLFSNLIIEEEQILGTERYTVFGILFYAFLLHIVVLFIYSITKMIRKRKQLASHYKRQIAYFVLGFAVAASLVVITNLLFPAVLGIYEYQIFAPVFTVFFAGFTTYAIIRYRLMEIRFVLSKSLLYAALAILISVLFVLVAFIGPLYFVQLTPEVEIGLLLLASFIIAIGLEPIKKILARLTDRIFFKAAIDYPTLTKALTDIINEEIELDSLIRNFTAALEKGLRVEHATILLPVGEEAFIEPEELMQDPEKHETHRTLARTSPLVEQLYRSDTTIILDELDMQVSNADTTTERERYEAIRTHLEEIGGYAAVPISTKDKIVAILILAKKKSGEAFSVRDVQLLEVIGPQVASGIEKARLYQEEKEFATKLKREVERATAELKAANEKLKDLDRAKSEFMSIASHQLRTPLAGILGYLSMIMQGDFGEIQKTQKPILADVFEATNRLIRMVNVFLNVTRIEAGRFVMNFESVPFMKIIEDEYKELLPTAEKKNVKLVLKKSKLPEVEVDKDKIKDVVLNLIDNAIKYSPNGTVTVWGEKVGDDKVQFHCKDTGVGIEPVEAENLFSKFVRGSGIARVDPSGSGLGLFIAKKITESHGGRIWAESEGEGKGSTFSFEIPIKADKKAIKEAKEFHERARKKEQSKEAANAGGADEPEGK